MIDLFGNEEQPRAPRRPTKPAWSRVKPRSRKQVGSRCNLCVIELAESWRQGVRFVPARNAIWCRVAGAVTLYLCQDHALPLRQADDKAYARAKRAPKRGDRP